MTKNFAASASLLILLIVAAGVSAQETTEPESSTGVKTPQDLPFSMYAPVQPPRWSMEIKAGDFEPDLDDWQRFYGDEQTDEIGIAVAYKIIRWLEVGMAVDYMDDKGSGQLPISDTVGGNVTYELYPAHVYVLLRGLFHENQRFVPYIGGGFTRAFYRQQIDNQPTRRGDADGEHVRAGLQILLDWVDRDGASSMENDLGVNNTYLTFEIKKFSAEVDGVELGGESAMIGLLFEF